MKTLVDKNLRKEGKRVVAMQFKFLKFSLK